MAQPKKILLVEDDGALREEIATAISELGVEVVQAADGIEGLAHLATSPPPAAILLDLETPRHDVGGFLTALREEPAFAACAEVPVVTMENDAEAAPSEVLASRLRKPFDLHELAHLLVSLCGT